MAEHINIKCKCERIMLEADFIKHFSTCDQFKKNFRTFDTQFGELLRTHSEEKENLLIIKVLLKQYVNVLNKKIVST